LRIASSTPGGILNQPIAGGGAVGVSLIDGYGCVFKKVETSKEKYMLMGK